MKFKYFLRGLGIGIIFASVIFLTAYQGNASKELTDAEIIEKAKELGMVEKEDHLKNLLSSEEEISQDVSVSEETQEKGSEEDTGTENLEKQGSEDGTGENTTEQSTEKDTSEADTEAEKNTENNTTKSNTSKQDADKESVTITIERGASSYPICQKLQELGMIEDAAEFDTYLVEKGYASRIRVGTHTLKKGMSFHDIAEAISDPL